eukprot:1160490-Pelagomonas_calceolata.AAC.5
MICCPPQQALFLVRKHLDVQATRVWLAFCDVQRVPVHNIWGAQSSLASGPAGHRKGLHLPQLATCMNERPQIYPINCTRF